MVSAKWHQLMRPWKPLWIKNLSVSKECNKLNRKIKSLQCKIRRRKKKISIKKLWRTTRRKKVPQRFWRQFCVCGKQEASKNILMNFKSILGFEILAADKILTNCKSLKKWYLFYGPPGIFNWFECGVVKFLFFQRCPFSKWCSRSGFMLGNALSIWEIYTKKKYTKKN